MIITGKYKIIELYRYRRCKRKLRKNEAEENKENKKGRKDRPIFLGKVNKVQCCEAA
jgi:hypothetical protein